MDWTQLYPFEQKTFAQSARLARQVMRTRLNSIPKPGTCLNDQRLGFTYMKNPFRMSVLEMLYVLEARKEPYQLAAFLDKLVDAANLSDAVRIAAIWLGATRKELKQPGWLHGLTVSDYNRVAAELKSFYRQYQTHLLQEAAECNKMAGDHLQDAQKIAERMCLL